MRCLSASYAGALGAASKAQQYITGWHYVGFEYLRRAPNECNGGRARY